MTFNNHLTKNKHIIKTLKFKELNDPNIISILLIETYYRSIFFRTFEYLYWILTGDKKITIGLAQMKVMYIKQLKDLNFLERIKFVIRLESYIENYILIKQYLDINKSLKNDIDICKYYNGIDTNRYYIINFKYAKKYVSSIK